MKPVESYKKIVVETSKKVQKFMRIKRS